MSQSITASGLSSTTEVGIPTATRGVQPCPPVFLRQTIHPVEAFCTPPSGIQRVPNGTCFIWPIMIDPGMTYRLACEHISALDPVPGGVPTAPDWSILMWLARDPLGQGVGVGGFPSPSWRPRRVPRIVRLQDAANPAPDTTEWLGFEPGPYWMHCLNLVNSANWVRLELTQE